MNDIEINAMPSVAAMRAVFGSELVSTVRDQLILEASPAPYEFPGKKMALLLFSARSGSTFATQLLSKHADFRRVTDWFLPRRLEEMRARKGYATHHQVAQQILIGQTRTAFASKCIRESIIAAALLGILEQFRDHITFFHHRSSRQGGPSRLVPQGKDERPLSQQRGAGPHCSG